MKGKDKEGSYGKKGGKRGDKEDEGGIHELRIDLRKEETLLIRT